MAAIRTALQIGCFSDYSGGLTSNYAPNQFVMDATGKEFSGEFIADSTDAITHVGVRVGDTVTSPPVYQVSLQGSDANGFPNGTILGGGSPASATFNPTGWSTQSFHWIALDNPYSPTVGQTIMPTVEHSSGTIGASNRINFTRGWTTFVAQTRLGSRATTNNWSSGSRFADRASLALRTANLRNGVILMNTGPTAVSLGTAGHRDVVKFTLPEFFSSLTCYGIRATANPPSSLSFKLGVWNSAGTELGSESISIATMPSNLDAHVNCAFGTAVTISPGVTYYAGIERTDNACGLVHAELSEANDQLAYPLGTAACRATWNGSAWSDNATFRPLSLELLISDITGGGGGASFPLIGGGGLIY
jgi:hypothetical protein